MIAQYGAPAPEPMVNSKKIYVEEQLGYSHESVIFSIAQDFGFLQPEGSIGIVDRYDSRLVRLWGGSNFRLFISHASKYRAGAHALADEISHHSIDGFVAHDALEPSLEWQAQIEQALQSMDALAIIVTEEVLKSSWCDQEVGWALGAGKLVVPIRVTADPHGFVGKYQALNGYRRTKADLAFELACVLAGNPRTSAAATGIASNIGQYVCRAEQSEAKFWQAIAALSDGGQPILSQIAEGIVRRMEEKQFYQPGLAEQFPEVLERSSLRELAQRFINATPIPF